VDAKTIDLEIDIGKRTFTIQQSPGLLQSNRDAGTTGAVLWKITPHVANWLSSTNNFLWKQGWLQSGSTIVEVGCGISGLIALAMSPLLSSGCYILTDQAYVMKILQHNVTTNQPCQPSGRGSRQRQRLQVQTLALDWETDAVSNITSLLGKPGKERKIDLILACDCIYNEYLIKPFVSTCASLCALRSGGSKNTAFLIAQQLRSEEVLQLWLEEMLSSFHVFRIPASLLPDDLGRGYVIHFAILR
jgi:Lysine methyltransferase